MPTPKWDLNLLHNDIWLFTNGLQTILPQPLEIPPLQQIPMNLENQDEAADSEEMEQEEEQPFLRR